MPAGLTVLDAAAAALGRPLKIGRGGLREGVILELAGGRHRPTREQHSRTGRGRCRSISRIPGLYFNRELSWLEFNQRVIELAEDPGVPLLERLKFIAIAANNLDEFFMVRVAGLHDQVDAGIETPAAGRAHAARDARGDPRQGHASTWTARRACLQGELRPALAEHGIRIVSLDDVSADERERLDERFRRQIFPVLTPLAVGLGRPFPYISNLSLSLGVVVHDPVSHTQVFARVKVPTEMLPRFVPFADGRTFVPLEELIAKHLDQLFPGMEIVDTAVFRVTRDADFTVSDEADDLLQAVEDELRRRRFGEVVRVEVEAGMSREMREQLERALEAEHEDVLAIDGLLDLNDLWEIVKIPGFPELRDPPWTPLTQPRLHAAGVRGGRRDGGDARGRHPPAPPLRLVLDARSSGSSRRRSPTPTCSRSSRPCTARATTRRSSRR